MRWLRSFFRSSLTMLKAEIVSEHVMERSRDIEKLYDELRANLGESRELLPTLRAIHNEQLLTQQKTEALAAHLGLSLTVDLDGEIIIKEKK